MNSAPPESCTPTAVRAAPLPELLSVELRAPTTVRLEEARGSRSAGRPCWRG
jgi:hypothetical protein